MPRSLSSGGGTKKRILIFSALLVLVSVVGSYFVIEQSKQTETYWVSKVNLPSGAPLGESALEPIELSLFASGDRYLSPSISLDSAYLLRPISPGELIPLSAISSQALDDYANLVITPSLQLSSELVPGSKVSLWSAPRIDYQSYGEPIVLSLDVEVVAITKPQGGFGASQEVVEVRVPAESVQYLLASIANGDSLALVGSGESLGG